MTLTVNGRPHPAAGADTLLDLVAGWTGRDLGADGRPADGAPLGIAVAVDGAVVPRARWAATPAAGAVDIVTAVQGG
ncbi:sulfur carrier protein ThiS [Corynebacterium sphenisci]|uniref:sulfur carrier protein ThiS n=1 Tax=Corynebacterium sphenisci TaxID=191493 RepID=UPI0026DFFE60|nr:sulfur carrier protein ThiS [Corynebacterium sphenisci]MDO5731295.1 sulfur carrier protein ThiS [Corynebacterium sphenisci]